MDEYSQSRPYYFKPFKFTFLLPSKNTIQPAILVLMKGLEKLPLYANF
jgi:hypothetical protein